MTRPVVTMAVGGHVHRGWKAGSVGLSLQQLSGQFSFDASRIWNVDGRAVACPVAGLAPVSVSIGGEVVITGLIDQVQDFYRAGDVGVRLAGRDATARLNDCSLAKREFSGVGLAAIARTLAGEFGIPVRLVNHDGGRVFTRFTVDVGSTYARAIEDACRQVGAMMWTDGTGVLLIGRPGGGDHIGTLRLGTHILEASGGVNFADRFSRVRVLTNRSGDDAWSNAGAVPQGQASDAEVTVFRPMVIAGECQAEGAATPAERAAWEVTVRRARSAAIQVRVSGWVSPAGGLYRPGRRVDIDDDRLGRHGTLTIADVTLTERVGEGQISALTLMPAAAWTVLAEGQKSSAGGVS